MMQQAENLNNIEDVLGLCGVNDSTLTRPQKTDLDEKGFVIVPNVLDSKYLDRLRAAFEAAAVKDHQPTDAKQSGTRHIDNLLNADPIFHVSFTHANVLAAAYHVLKRPFRLSQFGSRDPLPGYGQQGLHTDWMQRSPSEPFRVVTAIWLLDDFTQNNGATRLVPGTHLLIKPIPKSMAAPANRHPDQIIVTGTAGSVLMFNGHLWHSGTRNDTNRPRRTLQCSFYGRELMGNSNINRESPESLSPSTRYLLGF